MPTEDQHIACASRTQKTIQHLMQDLDTHSPWIATAAFYKALHVVEAVFAKERGHHSCDHGGRRGLLERTRRYDHIARHYLILERAARNARYLPPGGVFDLWLSPQKVVDQLLNHALRQIEESASKMLTKPHELLMVGAK